MRHRDLEDAALPGFLRDRLGRRGKTDHAVGHRRRGAEDAGQSQELAPVHLAGLDGLRQLANVMGNPVAVALVEGHDFLPL